MNNINSIFFSGNTLLHEAASSPNNVIDVLIYLKNNRFDPNTRNNLGESPLHVCCSTGTLATLRFLIENWKKININGKMSSGSTPLERAAETNHLDMVK